VIMHDVYSNLEIIKRLLREHIKPYKNQLLLAVFFMIIVAASTAAIVKLVQPTIDYIFLSYDRRKLIVLPLMMIGVYSIKGVAEFYQSYLIKYTGQRILTDLQMRMYEHLLYADLAFIQSHSSGRLISRFTNDVALMRGAVSNLLVGAAKHFLTVVFLICMMFKLEPVLSIIVFAVFPIAIYPIQKLGRDIRKVLHHSQEELANYTSKLDETFQSIKVIKSFAGEQVASKRAGLIAHNILAFYKKAAKFDALVSPIMEILSGIAIGGIIWYGGNLVIDGKTTPGELMAFIIAFSSAYRPFKSLIALNVNLQEGLTAARRVFYILDIEPTINNSANAKKIEFPNPSIEFKDVELKFGKKIALKPTSFKISKNKVTAIVGASGSGKTSVSNLIVRFYEASAGEILVNDENIKDIELNSLREQISLVTQDIILFDMSVGENIAYGNASASFEEIQEAAILADAHEFILNLPEKYESLIGAQGVTLSGGQRQKLAIARAFLKKSNLLIFDEATSALDQRSEEIVLSTLTSKICRDKTTIMITHRLSAVVNAHNIIVMKAGRVIESGNHNSLISSKGEYYRLYNRELETDAKHI
jgi:ATP-binding cassette, subfamily B, bacterial MsbA